MATDQKVSERKKSLRKLYFKPSDNGASFVCLFRDTLSESFMGEIKWLKEKQERTVRSL